MLYIKYKPDASVQYTWLSIMSWVNKQITVKKGVTSIWLILPPICLI